MINLGKWPTMRVVGQSITTREADHVLVRTFPWWDTFPKRDGWEAEVRSIAAEYGMPRQPVAPEHGCSQAEHQAWMHETWHSWMPEFTEWCDQHGFLAMEMPSEDGICNNLITTTYRAWCTWDGLVAGQFNIGKWLGDDEIIGGFRLIAQQFPFLTMTVDLIPEDEQGRGGTVEDEGYSQALRIEVDRGLVSTHEGTVRPLVLPDEWYHWQNSANRMAEHGVSPQRLRLALAHILR